jgi:drug/metabolite transporter (DMT)-like permease
MPGNPGRQKEPLVQAHTQITLPVVLIVIGAGALHAVWNAIAKSCDDRLAIFALIGVASTVGGAGALALTGLPSRAAIGFAVVSAAIHIGYDLALIRSYRLGAFSQVYPIARGTSPLIVAFGAYFLAGERLSVLPAVGIAALAAGLASLALSSGRLTKSELPAVGTAALTGLTIASYTIVDGLGVRHGGDPFAYAGLLFLLQGPVFVVIAAARRPPASWLTGATAAKGLLAGALSLVAYGIVLWAQTKAPLAEVAAIRETSVVFAAVIGMKLFGESFGGRRVAAAVLVAAGIVLISA